MLPALIPWHYAFYASCCYSLCWQWWLEAGALLMSQTPPTFSHRIAGKVISAQLLEFKLKHPRSKAPTPAQKRGIAYEKKFLKAHTKLFPSLIHHPAFRFSSDRDERFWQYAIPDALLLLNDTINLFEVKYTHTADAWFQLHRLYLPIVQNAFPDSKINLIEVCRNYDPAVRLAGDITIVEDLLSFCSKEQRSFGIYIWSGRG